MQTDEQQFTAAVKRDLVTQFEIRGGPSQSFIAEVFRRYAPHLPLNSKIGEIAGSSLHPAT